MPGPLMMLPILGLLGAGRYGADMMEDRRRQQSIDERSALLGNGGGLLGYGSANPDGSISRQGQPNMRGLLAGGHTDIYDRIMSDRNRRQDRGFDLRDSRVAHERALELQNARDDAAMERTQATIGAQNAREATARERELLKLHNAYQSQLFATNAVDAAMNFFGGPGNLVDKIGNSEEFAMHAANLKFHGINYARQKTDAGAMEQADLEFFESIIANPSKITELNSTERGKFNSLMSMMQHDLQLQGRGLGYEPWKSSYLNAGPPEGLVAGRVNEAEQDAAPQYPSDPRAGIGRF